MHTIHYRWGFTRDQIEANPYALFHPVKNEADRNAFSTWAAGNQN
jgi:hypothetical protein